MRAETPASVHTCPRNCFFLFTLKTPSPSRIAFSRRQGVWLAVSAVTFLGAVLVVLRSNINEQNSIVEFITNVADAISGPFSRNDGIFDFSGKNADAKNALLNWGIAAIVYLLIGRLLANAIAPKGGR